ncbi:MAG: dienelactone hydrolase family protein [Anaerolineae bacterium]|nr:dienelactone hydrolase family protein [Anaerolineae bacterium]MDQ7035941.1 dienelactone hydrolase family protein [Anaerolineae bacterium]
MPIHDSGRMEFSIDSGYINIVADNGHTVPAYWAHPRVGKKFSGICLLHDWWGMNEVARLLANFFAQVGYYVIAPDMFHGATCDTPKQAMKLLKKTEASRYNAVDAALTVLESHHHTNRTVAAIGMGMGGTLAFEAAIKRDDLETAITYGGFPQQYFGQFARSNTPIMALFGSNEPFIKAPAIEKLSAELAATDLKDQHEVIVIENAGHEFFFEESTDKTQMIGKEVINHTLRYLENYLEVAEHQRKTPL